MPYTLNVRFSELFGQIPFPSSCSGLDVPHFSTFVSGISRTPDVTHIVTHSSCIVVHVSPHTIHRHGSGAVLIDGTESRSELVDVEAPQERRGERRSARPWRRKNCSPTRQQQMTVMEQIQQLQHVAAAATAESTRARDSDTHRPDTGQQGCSKLIGSRSLCRPPTSDGDEAKSSQWLRKEISEPLEWVIQRNVGLTNEKLDQTCGLRADPTEEMFDFVMSNTQFSLLTWIT